MKDQPKKGPLRGVWNSMLRLEWSARSRLAFLLLLSIPLTWVVHLLPLLPLEAALYDLRIRIAAPFSSQPLPGVTVIAIDEYSARRLDDFLPMDFANQARIVDRIARARPRVLGVLTGHENLTLESSSAAEQLYSALRKTEDSGVPVLLGTGFDVMGERLPPQPLASLPHAIAILHKDGNVFGEDKVTRRALVRLYDRPVFTTRLAELAMEKDKDPSGAERLAHELENSSYRLPQIRADYTFFDYSGNPAVTGGKTTASRLTSSLSFRWHSAAELLEGKIPEEDLRDRAVILGSMNLEDSRDFVATPYSRAPFETPKLALHAQIVSSLLSKGLIRPIPLSLELLAIWVLMVTSLILVSGSAALLIPTTSPRLPRTLFALGGGAPGPSLFAASVISVGFIGLNGIVFTVARIWIPAAAPLIGAMIASYLILPFRLMSEYSARWETEQKNAVLRQVDELKRNFLSLVTHDLKTPVARIQGLAETLQRRQARAKSIERRADDTENPELVNHMLDAAEELNRFISSILDLNRIDSQPPRLRIESKDINRVIEDVIRRHEPQAHRHAIRIETQLEPLFPIRCDVELISKVLSNLVDNAIKYSGSGSTVTIRSREHDGCVSLIVEDHGVGMSEEETRLLFTRFFRAKNERTAGIAGSGLGLHLARYFVEMHEGTIDVESRPGEGSRFRIELPIDGPTKISGAAPAHPGLTRTSGGVEDSTNREEENHA